MALVYFVSRKASRAVFLWSALLGFFCAFASHHEAALDMRSVEVPEPASDGFSNSPGNSVNNTLGNVTTAYEFFARATRELRSARVDRLRRLKKRTLRELRTTHNFNITSNRMERSPHEREVLKDIRSHFDNSLVIGMWRDDLDHCLWEGVGCVHGQVHSLEFFERLTKIPESITKLMFLRKVVIANGNMTTVPDAIYKIPNLRRLSVVRSEVLHPGNINLAKFLFVLKFEENPMTHFPKDAWGRRIKRLYWYCGNCEATSVDLRMFPKLNRLSLKNFGFIKDDPNWLKLPFGRGLATVTLKNVRTSRLPDDMFLKQDRMKYLYIGNMPLVKEVPQKLSMFTNLGSLIITKTSITRLPSLQYMHRLSIVNLRENELEELTHSIRDCKKLRRLDVSHNQLQELPDLSTLPKMNDLAVAHNKLTTLPDLSAQDLIGTFHAEGNRLTELPHWVLQSRLRKIVVNDNRLKYVVIRGAAVGLRLSELYLHNNPGLRINFDWSRLGSLSTLTVDVDTLLDALKQFSTLRHVQYRHPAAEVLEFPSKTMIGLQTFILASWTPTRAATPLPGDPTGSFLFTKSQWLRDRGSTGEESRWFQMSLPTDAELVELQMWASLSAQSEGNHSEKIIQNGIFAFERKCLSGFYAREGVVDDMERCLPCDRNAHCYGGVMKCVSGFYLADTGSTKSCEECPKGGVCKDNDVYPEPGYWRSSPGTAQLMKCSVGDVCEGGVESGCAEGYEGPMCGSCQLGYFSPARNVCNKCPSTFLAVTWVAATYTLLFALVIFILVQGEVWQWKFIRGFKRSMRFQASMMATSSRLSMSQMKIIISFLQLLGSLDVVYNVSWPSELRYLFVVLTWLNFDFIKVSSVECLVKDTTGRFTFYHTLVFMAVLPILTAALSALSGGLILLLGKGIKLCGVRGGVSHTSVVTKILRLNFVVMFLAYMPISQKGFSYFRCTLVDGQYFLAEDLSVMCYTDTYDKFYFVALFLLIFYTAGVPFAMVVYLLSCSRNLDKDVHLQSAGIFYMPYKKMFAWWEAEELIRRMLLGAALIMLGNQGMFQLTVGLLISFLALVLHLRVMPFKNIFDNRLQAAHLILLFLNLTLALTKKYDVPDEEGAIFMWFVMALNVFITMFLLVQFALILYLCVLLVLSLGSALVSRCRRKISGRRTSNAANDETLLGNDKQT